MAMFFVEVPLWSLLIVHHLRSLSLVWLLWVQILLKVASPPDMCVRSAASNIWMVIDFHLPTTIMSVHLA